MKLIVGLGNPGEKYVGVRHNLGFMVADELVDRLQGAGDSWKKNEKLKSEICNLRQLAVARSCELVSKFLKTETCNLVLAKPQTYMNNSGMAVKLLASYYKITPEDIIIIHDELDLPLGKIKVRKGGAAAGHHGVESIIASLGTDQFIRVRVGIGPAVGVVEKFVLKPFISKEKPQVKHVIKQVLKAIDLLLEKGLEKAQNQYN